MAFCQGIAVWQTHLVFSSPVHKVLMVSFCDRPMSSVFDISYVASPSGPLPRLFIWRRSTTLIIWPWTMIFGPVSILFIWYPWGQNWPHPGGGGGGGGGGVISWNNSNREGRIHFVGKLTQLSDSGPSWPFCFFFFFNHFTLSQTSTGFYVSAVQVFWKHCVKMRNCSPFPTVFSTLFENFLPFLSDLKLLPANSFSLEE